MDAVANRVKRVATGWETQLGIAVDDVVSRSTMLDLCSAFYAECAVRARGASAARSAHAPSAAAAAPGASPPPTRLRLRTEVMAGTWEALVTGQADLAIGVGLARELPSGVDDEGARHDAPSASRSRRTTRSPRASEPLADAEHDPPSRGRRRRLGAPADADHRQPAARPGRAHRRATCRPRSTRSLRGIGCGFVPDADGARAIAAGRLVVKAVQRAQPTGAARLRLARRPGAQRARASRARAGAALVARAARSVRRRGARCSSATATTAALDLPERIRVDASASVTRVRRSAQADRRTVASLAYVGRFAPSPTGLLHAGSLVAALASWLDARAHGGRWLVRIEDLDTPRNVAGAAEAILGQLDRCGLRPDGAGRCGSRAATALYEAALQRLLAHGRAYPCAAAGATSRSPRRRRSSAGRGSAPSAIYPGTCRDGLGGKPRALDAPARRGARRRSGEARA